MLPLCSRRSHRSLRSPKPPPRERKSWERLRGAPPPLHPASPFRRAGCRPFGACGRPCCSVTGLRRSHRALRPCAVGPRPALQPHHGRSPPEADQDQNRRREAVSAGGLAGAPAPPPRVGRRWARRAVLAAVPAPPAAFVLRGGGCGCARSCAAAAGFSRLGKRPTAATAAGFCSESSAVGEPRAVTLPCRGPSGLAGLLERQPAWVALPNRC